MSSEIRTKNLALTATYQTVFGNEPLTDINPGLRQVYALSELRVAVLLPSVEQYVHVSDSTKDPNQQLYERRLAFQAAGGNYVRVRIGGIEDPLKYSIKHVLGGYYFDLRPLLVGNPNQALMRPEVVTL
jgi:hypothetical protein